MCCHYVYYVCIMYVCLVFGVVYFVCMCLWYYDYVFIMYVNVCVCLIIDVLFSMVAIIISYGLCCMCLLIVMC